MISITRITVYKSAINFDLNHPPNTPGLHNVFRVSIFVHLQFTIFKLPNFELTSRSFHSLQSSKRSIYILSSIISANKSEYLSSEYIQKKTILNSHNLFYTLTNRLVSKGSKKE